MQRATGMSNDFRFYRLSFDKDIRQAVSVAARRIDQEGVAGSARGADDLVVSTSSHDRNDDDATLIAASANGDSAAYRILVERHLTWVLGIAVHMLHDESEAEDVTQETMLRLWRRASTLTIGANGIRPWLRRVVSNLCLDRIRALSAKPTINSDTLPERGVGAEQLQVLDEQELSKRVAMALQQLPDRQRLALVLFHFDGLRQNDIADVMSLSQDAVESLIARARRKLKQLLKDEWRALLPQEGREQ